jgi:hypothetical protein
MFNFLSDWRIFLIKIIAIYYIGFIFGAGGYSAAILTNKYIYDNILSKKKDEEKTTIHLMFETILIIATNNVLAYILRNILQEVPFPLDGISGFEYKRVKEFSSGGLVITIISLACTPLKEKIKILHERLFNKKSNE